MILRRVALAVTTLLALGGLSACGGGHDDADVAFAQQMVQHHQQALEMSRLAATNAAGAEVTALAGHIQKNQLDEVQTMRGWLADWDADKGSHGSHGTDHAMPGMVSQADLTRLRDARGPLFDRLWLTAMIAHHRGAVQMAKKEVAAGTDADAVALAKDIEKAQVKEIAQMREMLQ